MTTMQEENFVNILDGYVEKGERYLNVISCIFHKSLGGENNELS